MRKLILFLSLFLISLSCSTDDKNSCISNCEGEECSAFTEGVIDIKTPNPLYDFYSNCVFTRSFLDIQMTVLDLNTEGINSGDAIFSFYKNVDVSWEDLNGKTYTYKNGSEVNGETDLVQLYLFWSLVNPRDGISQVNFLLQDDATFTFSQITDSSSGSAIKVNCSGFASGYNDPSISVTNAEISIVVK